jgi:hypothetical protein
MKKAIRSAMLPVKLLWEYREFKRDEIAAPRIPLVHSYTVEQVTDHVKSHGMEPVELSIVKDRALLTDGNHRIVAASRLAMEVIPVTVTVFFGNADEVFYQHTINRFKPIGIALATYLKNIFLYDSAAGVEDVNPGDLKWLCNKGTVSEDI